MASGTGADKTRLQTCICMQWKLSKKISAIQGRNKGRLHHYGGAEGLRGAPKSPKNVTGSFFTQVRTWGRQTCFFPRAPSNLITSLVPRGGCVYLVLYCKLFKIRTFIFQSFVDSDFYKRQLVSVAVTCDNCIEKRLRLT